MRELRVDQLRFTVEEARIFLTKTMGLPLADAVTPAATGQALIASLRLVASVPSVLLIANVPLVELPQVGVPFEPAVALPQAKPLIVAVVPMLLPPVPAVFAVTVTVAPLDNAVTAATFLLIAAAMFAASVVVSVAVEKEVPVLVAGVPPLSVPPVQLNPVKLLESVMLFPATPPDTAVTVTVVVPLAVARVLPEFLVIALAMFVPSVPAVTPAAPDQI